MIRQQKMNSLKEKVRIKKEKLKARYKKKYRDRYEKLKNKEWQTIKKIDIHRERELRKMFLDGAEDKKFRKEEWEDNK